MSARDMWKMLHLLNNTSRDGLTKRSLDAGVDCYSDTLMELAMRGAVARARAPSGGSELWKLNDGARAVLNTCTVAQKLDGAAEVQVDRASVFCVMPFSQPWSDEVWKLCIEAAVIGAGLKPNRGDTTLRTGRLIHNVWNEILRSGCVIADLSHPIPTSTTSSAWRTRLAGMRSSWFRRASTCPADLKGAHYVEYALDQLPAAARDLQAKLEAWRDDGDIKVTRVEALFQ